MMKLSELVAIFCSILLTYISAFSICMSNQNKMVVIVDKLNEKGVGVSSLDSMQLFIPNTLPGERVMVTTSSLTKNIWRATADFIEQPSIDRVISPCEISTLCGGCQFQHMEYRAQLEFKHGLISNEFSKLPNLETIAVEDVLPSPLLFNYRNKAQFAIQRNGRKVEVGLYAVNTHQTIDTKSCAIQHRLVNDIMKRVRYFLRTFPVSVYDESTRLGSLRHIVIRVGFETNEAMVCLVSATEKIDHLQDFMAEMTRVVGVKSVLLNINNDPSDEVLGPVNRVLFGKPFISDVVAGVKVRISLQSFMQANPTQAAQLYRTVLELAALTGRETVWDLYCGVGTIGLFLAPFADKVFGIEDCAPAVADAELNARLNAVTNVRHICGKAEDVLRQQPVLPTGGHEVAIINPPRRGCHPALLKEVARRGVPRAVYVSCNPKTLARDLSLLVGMGYSVRQVKPVDMFPHTVHVETVVLLEKVG